MPGLNEALREAEARREALKAELGEIEQYIALHQKLFGGRDSSPSATKIDGKTETIGTNIKVRHRNRPSQIADMSAQAIRECNRPMQRGEIVDWIEANGVEIYSEDKPRYIGTILWRNSDRFENIEGEGYWLAELKRPTDESLFREESAS